MTPIRIALVGVGKIARDQHWPAIKTNPRFLLEATASRHGRLEGVPGFHDIDVLLDAVEGLDAIALCMPPGPRHEAAVKAIDRGLHVLLEKPPAATLSEIDDLVARAKLKGVTVFATWHSRFAAGVARAKEWLANKKIHSARIVWKEDVRKYHPGQDWIWEQGGFGVFDPGINALSIATEILPDAFFLSDALLTFPANRSQPIAADLVFRSQSGAKMDAAFDWRQTGEQFWDIHIEVEGGVLLLQSGGAKLTINGEVLVDAQDVEYAGIYARFADLVAKRQSDCDARPLVHVADAFMVGRRVTAEPFVD